MKKLLLLSTLCMYFLISCGGDDPVMEGEDPVLTISAPANGLKYTVPDTLVISGNAMDDGEITAITFNNGAEDTALDLSGATDKSNIDFNVTLALEDGTTPGDYEVTLTATDNASNMVSETVTFTIE